MSRNIKEFKNFNIGLVSNADSRDVPDEGAIFSKNVDPNAPGGVLRGMMHDVLKGDYDILGDDIYAKLRTALGIQTTEDVAVGESQVSVNGREGLFTGDYIGIGKSVFKVNGITDSFVAATGTVNCKSDSITDYDGKIVSISDTNGKTLDYIFDDDNEGATGTIDSAGRIRVQINGLSGKANVAEKLKLAIEHSNGHDDTITPVRTDGAVALTQVIPGLDGNSPISDTMADTAKLECTGFLNGSNASKLELSQALFGTEQTGSSASAVASEETEIYKLTIPVKAYQFLSSRITHLLLFDKSGRIDGYSNFESNSIQDNVGEGKNEGDSFSEFPVYLDKGERITIDSIFGKYYISNSSNNAPKWLGKFRKDNFLTENPEAYQLIDSELHSPSKGKTALNFEKIVTYEFTTTDSATAETPIPRLESGSGAMHVGYIRNQRFLYIIDGDTGVTHKSVDIGFNIEAIAKTVSCRTGIKLWVYKKGAEETENPQGGLERSPGEIHLIEIFNLRDEEPIDLSNPNTFPLGVNLSTHLIFNCSWYGGTAQNGPLYYYEENELNEQVYGSGNIFSGHPRISDILETVDSSGNGKLWIQASPDFYEGDNIDHKTGWFRQCLQFGDESMELHRHLWASKDTVDGDRTSGSTVPLTFEDKSMPLHTIHDYSFNYSMGSNYNRYYNEYNQIKLFTGLTKTRGRYQNKWSTSSWTNLPGVTNYNQHTDTNDPPTTFATAAKWKLNMLKRSAIDNNLEDSGYSIPASRTHTQTYEISNDVPYKQPSENSDEDTKKYYSLVHGGSFWYRQTPSSSGFAINRGYKVPVGYHGQGHNASSKYAYYVTGTSNTQDVARANKDKCQLHYAWNLRNCSLHYDEWTDRSHNTHSHFWNYKTMIMDSGGNLSARNDLGYVGNTGLCFYPEPGGLVDLSDLYNGVDHVVGSIIATGRKNATFLTDASIYTSKRTTNTGQTLGRNLTIEGTNGGSVSILWISSGARENYGASYVRSNSFGFNGTDYATSTSDNRADVGDNLNLSTLCYDTSDNVVRIMKFFNSFLEDEGSEQRFKGVVRCKPTHEYNLFSDFNDNDMRHSALFLSYINSAGKSEGKVIRLNTTLEQGVTLPTSYSGIASPYDGLAGYANPSQASSGAQGVIYNTGVATAKATSPANANQVIKLSGGIQASDGSLVAENLLAQQSTIWLFSGGLDDTGIRIDDKDTSSWDRLTADSATTIESQLPSNMPVEFLALPGNLSSSKDSSMTFFGFTDSVTNGPVDIQSGSSDTKDNYFGITSGINVSEIRGNAPLIIKSSTFQFIEDGTFSISTSLSGNHGETLADKNHIGFNKWYPIKIADASHETEISNLIFDENLTGLNSSHVSDLDDWNIINVWGRSKPDDATGVGGTVDAEASSKWLVNDYKMTIGNKVGAGKLFYCSLAGYKTYRDGYDDAGTSLDEIGGSSFPISDLVKGAFGNINNPEDQLIPYAYIKGISKYKAGSGVFVNLNFKVNEKATDMSTDDPEGPDNTGFEDNYPNNIPRNYKIAFEYDGFMESPLSLNTWAFSPNMELDSEGAALTDNYKSIDITINVPTTLSPRITAISIYRQGGATDDAANLFPYYNVSIEELTMGNGWMMTTVNGTSYWTKTITDEQTDNGTYEDINGIKENIISTSANYGISTSNNKYLFIADINNAAIENGEYMVMRSELDKFSVFNIGEKANQLVMDSPITALKYYNNSLYVFTRKNITRVNPDMMKEEDILVGYGCANNDAVVTTEYGMFFADKNHAYKHDGQRIKVISYPIETDDFSGENMGWQPNMKDDNIKVYFSSKKNLVIFLFSSDTSENVSTLSYAYSYHVLKERWDLINFSIKQTSFEQPLMDSGQIDASSDWAIYDPASTGFSYSEPSDTSTNELVITGTTSPEKQGAQLDVTHLDSSFYIPGELMKISVGLEGTSIVSEGGPTDPGASFKIEVGDITTDAFSITNNLSTYNFEVTPTDVTNGIKIYYESNVACTFQISSPSLYSNKTDVLYNQNVINEVIFESETNDKIYYFAGPFTDTNAFDEPYVQVCEMSEGNKRGSFAWHSKDVTIDSDTIDKRFLKLKIEADKTLTEIPLVFVDNKLVTLESSGTNEWKIRKNETTGASQKGRKVRVVLAKDSSNLGELAHEDITIFSMGIIYRTLKIK